MRFYETFSSFVCSLQENVDEMFVNFILLFLFAFIRVVAVDINETRRTEGREPVAPSHIALSVERRIALDMAGSQ